MWCFPLPVPGRHATPDNVTTAPSRRAGAKESKNTKKYPLRLAAPRPIHPHDANLVPRDNLRNCAELKE